MEAQELALKMAEAHFGAKDSLASEACGELVKQAAAGDRAAFERIVTLHEQLGTGTLKGR
jgi:hypothetical protein